MKSFLAIIALVVVGTAFAGEKPISGKQLNKYQDEGYSIQSNQVEFPGGFRIDAASLCIDGSNLRAPSQKICNDVDGFSFGGPCMNETVTEHVTPIKFAREECPGYSDGCDAASRVLVQYELPTSILVTVVSPSNGDSQTDSRDVVDSGVYALPRCSSK